MQKMSAKEKLQLFLQSAFGYTKQEIIILILFLSGGIFGMILRRTGPISITGLRMQEGIQKANHIIDSILKAEDARVDSVLAGSLIHDSMPSLLDKDIGVQFPKKEAKSPTIIDINTASTSALMNIPGIGPSTAEKIVEYRNEHPFTTIEDIMNVKGIGEKKFDKMKQWLKVGKKSVKTSNQ
ncbi:MAG: ComEA family DNA-binding protein [Ignavibacteria bacterium]